MAHSTMFRFTRTVLLLALVQWSAMGMVEVPSDEEWVSCGEFKETAQLAQCLCYVSEEEGFKVNCDHVVFPTDFPILPFRQPITFFSQRFVNYQTLPPQAFLAPNIPLQTLDLSNNWLRRLTEKSFEGLTETLEILDLSHNKFGDQLNPIFSTSEFKRLPRLRALTLGTNQLSHLDGGILDGCLSLEEFYLDNNDLKSVPSKSLKGPNALKILDISHNSIDVLRSDDFLQATSLVMLNVSGNILESIHGGSFRGMSSLKVLDLSWNRLQRLNGDSFMGLASIEEVILENNFLNQVPVGSLKLLPTLKVLKLSANLLQSMEGTTLKQLPNLEMIDLSRNRLSDIPKGLFSGLTRLREVNLGVNQLRTFPAAIFDGLTRLEKVNLMDNNILTFPAAALENLPTLTTLILDYNRISAITPTQPINLTEFSISNNLIREIPPETFNSFPNLTYLNLQGNQIASMEDVALPTTLLELNLAHNKLRSIPRFHLSSLEILNLKSNAIPALLQHNFVLLGNLRELNLADNVISSFFSNSFDGLDILLDLDLSGNKLQFLPKFGGFFELEILNFSRNVLTEVGVLERMENLKLLDLSHNEISNLNPDSLKNISSLISLDLSHNKMTSFKGFSDNLERLRTLDLSDNEISYVYPTSFDSVKNLWNLNFDNNRFALFPTEFLKPCKQLRFFGLSRNQLKNLNEMNFSNFPYLRELDLGRNSIEFVTQNAFLNCSQLQRLNFSGNKLENLDANIFQGLLRLELDLSDNFLSSLPPSLFDRGQVQKLHKIWLSRNAFTTIPADALQKQYFYLEELHIAENKIADVPENLNILVNVKTLDLSFNPLSEASLKHILNEPKTVRSLNIANCSIKALPALEMPFLKELMLSGNMISGFDETTFQRTTLLDSLDLSKNLLTVVEQPFPASLKSLDISSNPLSLIAGGHFPQSLETLKLNSLEHLVKVEKSGLNLKNLKLIEAYDLPKLGYLDIRGILTNLHFLEGFDFEVKDHQVLDQLHPGLTARVKRIGLRGRRIRSISTGAFAGLGSPEVEISLVNTSLSILPSILVPLPMSSRIKLDISGSPISNLSPPFLAQNIQLQGLSPTCDCNAVNLVRYLQSQNRNGPEVVCAGPPKLKGTSVMSLSASELTCDSGSSTTAIPEPPSVSITTTTTSEPETQKSTTDDIIWSVAPPTPKTGRGRNKASNGKKVTEPAKADQVNNMDSLIFGIVGGVVILIVLFVIIIVCFVKLNGSSGSTDGIYPPPAPSVVSVGPRGAGLYSLQGPMGPVGSKCTCSGKGPHFHPQQQHHPYMMTMGYGTVRSNMNMNMNMEKMYGTYAVQGPASLHSMGPQSLSPYVKSNYSNYGGGGGPTFLRQQGMPSYPSNHYYTQQDSDYESRR